MASASSEDGAGKDRLRKPTPTTRAARRGSSKPKPANEPHAPNVGDTQSDRPPNEPHQNTDADGDVSHIITAVNASTDRIIAESGLSRAEILDAIKRRLEPTHEDVTDEALRQAVELLQGHINEIVVQARDYSHVDLRLDDLFEVVTALTPEAKTIEAVDQEIHRWTTDPRAKTYEERNLIALQLGARIKRVYVISPDITVDMMGDIQDALNRHLSFNELGGSGSIEIKAIYYEDLRQSGDPHDFAIFDGKKLLFETFNEDWTSTFRGQLTTDDEAVSGRRAYFNLLWKKSEKLLSETDVAAWTDKTRNRILNRGVTEDVFLGYTGRADDIALRIEDYIASRGYRVRKWKEFPAASALLEEIGKACRECHLGLFLFTNKDLPDLAADLALSTDDDERDNAIKKFKKALSSRDNVVLECGYFLSTKGENRVAAIVESGTPQPTDLGGKLWIPLADGELVSTIHAKLLEWLESQLGPRPKRK